MDPATAVALVALGAAFVFLSGRSSSGSTRLHDLGQSLGLVGPDPSSVIVPGITPQAPPRLTQQMVEYYLSGFATHLTDAQAAAAGASAGSSLAIPTFGISIGVGALLGYFGVANSNDTLEDRQVFAKRLGFPTGVGVHTMPVRDASDKSAGLYAYLFFMQRGDLAGQAMWTIGRKDFVGNVNWMVAVLKALADYSAFQFPSV
jgi:hypothetical protein